MGALALAYAAACLAGAPLRRFTEGQMNARLRGYRVHIDRMVLHPLGLGVDFHDLVLTQSAHPDPAVLRIPRLAASVQWSALLHGRLVADFALDSPAMHLDRTHFANELEDSTPLQEHGWQEAVEAMYPLKINELVVRGGSLTYLDAEGSQPLALRDLDLVARNIRNVKSAASTYPSSLEAHAVIFDDGRLALDGHADFLRAPHAAVQGQIALERIGVDRLQPIAARYGLKLRAGSFDARGRLEYAPEAESVELDEVHVRGLQAEYSNDPRSLASARRALEAARQAAAGGPPLAFLARRIEVEDSTLSFANQRTDPHYRVFLAGVHLLGENLGNQTGHGDGSIRLAGSFMGSGRTRARATFRPEQNGPDFDLALRIGDTDLEALNDLLRAHARIDAASGSFSVYSEMHVEDERVDGYVKPLFKDVEIYDPAQDADKSLGRKLKEKAVEVVGDALRNRPREEVATVIPVEGPVQDPHAGTAQTVLGLLQNAFFKAILPGFERQRRVGTGD